MITVRATRTTRLTAEKEFEVDNERLIFDNFYTMFEKNELLKLGNYGELNAQFESLHVKETVVGKPTIWVSVFCDCNPTEMVEAIMERCVEITQLNEQDLLP